MIEKFKVQAVRGDGSKTAIEAKELIITLDDKELKISVFTCEDRKVLSLFSNHAGFTLQPGACNSVDLWLHSLDTLS